MEFTFPNNVVFYAYDGSGNRLSYAALDGQGPKMIPYMCMACHGGTAYDQTTLPSGSSFLPFDLSNFQYSAQPGFTKTAQQEAFRQLNAYVLFTTQNSTNTNNPIGTLINGWYNGAVNTSGTTANEAFIPPGWSNQGDGTNPTDLYTEVVRPYCRTCHIAQTVFDWTTYAQFKGAAPGVIQNDLNVSHVMPHAEVPYLSMQNNLLALACFQNYLQALQANTLGQQGQGC